jgi:hypothetical protein
MSPKMITISLLMLTSCHHKQDEPQTPTPESQPEAVADSLPATPDSEPVADNPSPEPPKVTLALADLPNYVGKSVTLQGKITDLPYQHVMAPPAGTKHDYYFNLDKSQIVLYTVEEISCGTTLEVTGTVLEIQGAAKRGAKPGDSYYKEYHLNVASWKCIP